MTQVAKRKTLVFLPFRTVWFLDKNSDLSVNVSVDEDFCNWGIMTLDLEFDPDLALRRREDVVGLMGLERLIFYHLYFSKMRHLWNFFHQKLNYIFQKWQLDIYPPKKWTFPKDSVLQFYGQETTSKFYLRLTYYRLNKEIWANLGYCSHFNEAYFEQALPDKIGSKMDQLMNINCLYVSSLRYVKVDFDPQGLRPQRIQVEQV